jgi:hypothetical protein
LSCPGFGLLLLGGQVHVEIAVAEPPVPNRMAMPARANADQGDP